MKTLTVKTTTCNEVSPHELDKLFGNGAKLIKNGFTNGRFIGEFIQTDGKRVVAYSDDDIIINNITLPLSINADYCCEITINVR